MPVNFLITMNSLSLLVIILYYYWESIKHNNPVKTFYQKISNFYTIYKGLVVMAMS